MSLSGLLGAGIFVVWSFFLGGRLLLLARRTRQLPELVIGIAFLASGGVGFALQIAAQADLGLAPDLQSRTMAAGKLFVQLGVVCQALFTWRVFRAGRGWAASLFVGLAAGLLLVSAGYGITGNLGDHTYSGAWFWLECSLQMAATGWGAVEALRYWVLMRRRLTLGLADPVVTNRFLLWGIAISAGTLAVGVGGLIHALGVESPYTPGLIGLAGFVAVVSAVGYWLTFFPPATYRSFLATQGGGETPCDA